MNTSARGAVTLVLLALVSFQNVAAAARPPSAEPLHTELDVTIDPELGQLRGAMTTRIDLTAPDAERLVFNLNRGLAVDRVLGSGGLEVPYERDADSLVVRLPRSQDAAAPLDLTVAFSGPLHNDAADMGYSMAAIGPECSFASWLSSWYPQLRRANGKSPGTLTFRVPSGLVVVSNGLLAEQSTTGDSSLYVFSVREPVYYSFAVGKYHVSRRDVGGIEVTTHFLSGDMAKGEWYLERLCEVLDYYRGDLYGMYPYGRCSMVELPARVMGRSGGSSEQGLFFFPDVALDDAYFSLPVVAHELGHAYWGNWVIGDGVFMSEGLAQASCALCLEHMLDRETMQEFLKYGSHDSFQSAALYFATAAGDPERDLPLDTPTAEADPMVMHFLSNTKGVCVLIMLRDEIGHGPFREALRNALADHAHSLMTVGQLQEELERASGRDLDPFFGEWFRGTGAPGLMIGQAVVSEQFAGLRDFGDAFQSYLSGDLAGAEELFRRQLASTPDSILPRFWLADLCFRFKQDRASAVELLDPIVDAGAAVRPSPLLWSSSAVMLGKAYDALGKRPKAIACYERVLDEDGTGLFHELATKYLEHPYVSPPPLPPLPPPGEEE